MGDFELELLFKRILNAGTETELLNLIQKKAAIFDKPENWRPLGGQQSNFSIIKNQQSSPIAALIEKVTNSIDAILMRKCLEAGLDPKSKHAPQSMEEAIKTFFPDFANWEDGRSRSAQSENIQIIASGVPGDTSVIVYDNGEGQDPENFETTFLSLMRSNKNEIPFVQGKYNMGGSGALVFCGKHSFQLIASKRFTGEGKMGFTLVRKHPLTADEKLRIKETWFEYLVIDGQIPSFKVEDLGIGLGLRNRAFRTGSILKLYSYQFPKGYSGFAQELNQSLNEFLFRPALPLFTIDTKERYPNNKVLELDLFGLKRALENARGSYVEEVITDYYTDSLFGPTGKITVTSYVFKTTHKDKDAKKTREDIQRRFFKNEMAVLFTLNGQVHGSYKREFFSRSNLNLLRDHLLVHVDCTETDYDFRSELFMASRDRLKEGEVTQALRSFLKEKLGGADSELKKIERHRRDSLSAGGAETAEVIRNFAKKIPMNSEMMKLLGSTFKLEQSSEEKKKPAKKENETTPPEPVPFVGKRFPSFLKLKGDASPEKKTTRVPMGSMATIRLETDVENEYFSRSEEAGDLKLQLLDYVPNDSTGGTGPGAPKEVAEILNIHVASPRDGTIRLNIGAKATAQIGDRMQVSAKLVDPEGEFEALFWVRIEDAKKEKVVPPPVANEVPDQLGLPELVLAFINPEPGKGISWQDLETSGKSMDEDVVMVPMVEGDALEKIIVNMDSKVIKDFKAKQRKMTYEQVELAHRKYTTGVYFHTLFLYSITRKRGYQMTVQKDDQAETVALEDYLQDVFQSHYSEFLLNFGGVDELMSGLGE